ncbi:hypothetical protein N7509_008169 [Penicillium cosmopolitanum]|uniref:Deuterolysin n=1 Tax=Penicillium cosmopolitanum TaxID=1131564 RepID=A0A9W9W0C2_9EURO|nr:uncharacterized protein N7509_008169 [Penicillium cosmopolitanum]KAJ5392679.1 hypothetical protein N7509_008169 [Penicillium cosmopolitanum]
MRSNIEKAMENLMKWPAAVEKSLVKDKRINDMAASLFNAVDYAKVKGDLTQFKHICPTDTALAFSETINKVGAQSQKTTPGSGDREDPIIYCDLDRYLVIYDKKNPKKLQALDTIHNYPVSHEIYEGCEKRTQDITAYTTPRTNANGKGQTVIQLCPWYLKEVGQTPFLNRNGEPQNNKLHNAADILYQSRGTPVHIDDFARLELTLFHEFVHTPKVKYPAIGDSGTYWGSCTRLTEAQALDNAESYAMLSLATYLMSTLDATIKPDGTIEWEQDELSAGQKRSEVVGQQFTA